MAPYSKSALVLMIFLAGAIMAANAGGKSPPPPSSAIVKACSSVEDKEFCIGSLSSAPGALKANMKKLAVIAAKLSLKEAKAVSRYVVNMEKVVNTSNGALEDCVELYKDAVSDLKTALSALKGGDADDDVEEDVDDDYVEDDVDDARAYLSAADTNTDTCFDGLSAQPDINGRIQKRSLNLSKLIEDALAVTAKLAGDRDDP